MEEVKNEAVEPKKLNFLEEIIESDLKSGKVDSVLTRPSGAERLPASWTRQEYLHQFRTCPEVWRKDELAF